MLQISCPHCGQPLQIPEQYAGKVGQCKKCGGSFAVPALAKPVVPDFGVGPLASAPATPVTSNIAHMQPVWKKRWGWALLGVVITAVAVGAVVLFLARGRAVAFPDKQLEAAIREALNKTTGPLYAEELSKIKELKANRKDIADLRGIEYCTGVTHLELQNNVISDITPLSQLADLQELLIDFNKIESISPLKQLANLRGLCIAVNPIKDLSPLKGLTNLKALDIEAIGTAAGDLSVISALTQLETLYTSGNGIRDLGPVAGLNNLQVLWLMKNAITDLTPLANLRNLRELQLDANSIVDVTPLKNLENLALLSLPYNRVDDVQPLVDNPGLGKGDTVCLANMNPDPKNPWDGANPLSQKALAEQVPALQKRGVQVAYVGTPDARMQWWREAKFGMIIHWGFLGASNELDSETNDPRLATFNPQSFRPDAWVALAKETGMKYLVMITKHEDGFCRFDSAQTDYDVMSTPFKRDIMKGVAEECRKGGLRLGWYYSIMDRHHPDYLPRNDNDRRPTNGADYNRYINFMQAQVEELLTNYGPIDLMWFDGYWGHKAQEHRSWETLALIRRLQPDIIVNSGLSVPGDYQTVDTPGENISDQPGSMTRYWEVVNPSGASYGYRAGDNQWKSPEELVAMLVEVVAKGGNLLLDIAVTPDGEVPAPLADTLHAVGRWLEQNGESIYSTNPGPLGKMPWGWSTAKGKKLYLHVLYWPAGGKLKLSSLNGPAKKAYILSDPKCTEIPLEQSGPNLILTLPPLWQDPIATVVVLECDAPIVEAKPQRP